MSADAQGGLRELKRKDAELEQTIEKTHRGGGSGHGSGSPNTLRPAPFLQERPITINLGYKLVLGSQSPRPNSRSSSSTSPNCAANSARELIFSLGVDVGPGSRSSRKNRCRQATHRLFSRLRGGTGRDRETDLNTVDIDGAGRGRGDSPPDRPARVAGEH